MTQVVGVLGLFVVGVLGLFVYFRKDRLEMCQKRNQMMLCQQNVVSFRIPHRTVKFCIKSKSSLLQNQQ